jgi:hypothetical protein
MKLISVQPCVVLDMILHDLVYLHGLTFKTPSPPPHNEGNWFNVCASFCVLA